MIALRDVPGPCFDGIVPATVTTCSAAGIPNVAVLSQVFRLDETHIALSRQFFNKTTRNLLEEPRALVELWDPINFDVYRFRATWQRAETSGPVFDVMAARIEAIASHSGMKGIFRLQAVDVLEVASVERVTEHLGPVIDVGDGLPEEPLTQAPSAREELWVLQRLSQHINRAVHLEDLFECVLEGLAVDFGFEHSMVLLVGEDERLFTVASRGYPRDGLGSEVALGEGLIGTAARERRILRVGALDRELSYSRAIKAGYVARPDCPRFGPSIPLPGLADAQSQLALPLTVGDRLLGVLALESRDRTCFESWHEAFLGVVADQVASAIDRLSEDEPTHEPRSTRTFVLYQNDDAVFLDDTYLIRNVPARILWRLLREHRDRGRTEFTNRELRLDPTLGLPPLKDNLESRLILLRKRLEEKCPDVRLVRRGRGRFALEVECALVLEERADSTHSDATTGGRGAGTRLRTGGRLRR